MKLKRTPFEQIVTRHGPAVLRVCRAVLGRHDAEEAWSETFLAALRAYPELDPQANVEAWLVRIAKRKAVDQLRASSRRPSPTEQVPDAPAPVTNHSELYSALRSLPLKQREAIAYHHLAGLPYAEIADILGNSEVAARRAAADGMRRLREIYVGGSDEL